jgi:hypothetical protein
MRPQIEPKYKKILIGAVLRVKNSTPVRKYLFISGFRFSAFFLLQSENQKK